MRLHSQARAVVDELDRLGPGPIEPLGPEEARRQPTATEVADSLLRKRRGAEPAPEEVGRVEEPDGPRAGRGAADPGVLAPGQGRGARPRPCDGPLRG